MIPLSLRLKLRGFNTAQLGILESLADADAYWRNVRGFVSGVATGQDKLTHRQINWLTSIQYDLEQEEWKRKRTSGT